jgi:tRNA nucleotidyltransferase/poly(A) polymerase
VVAGTIMDDLSRRDFAMNAIAQDVESGEILDPFGGRADIEKKIIRAVGSANERINEDPLRLLRALRFCITLNFALDSGIIKLLSGSEMPRKMVKTISQDRIREELERMFKANTLKTLQMMECFPIMRDMVFGGDLWIKVTNEKRKKK